MKKRAAELSVQLQAAQELARKQAAELVQLREEGRAREAELIARGERLEAERGVVGRGDDDRVARRRRGE